MSGSEDAGPPLPMARSEREEATLAAGWENAGQENMPEAKPEEATHKISVKVVDQQSNEVFFQIKKSTKLGKVMGAYCQRQGLDLGSVRFLHDGERIVETQTAGDRDMEDGETIQVVLQQLGGADPDAPVTPPAIADPEEDGAEPKKLSVKVQDQQNNELHFTIKPHTKLSRVMTAFRQRQGLAVGSVKFIHEGTRIQDNDTPESLEMEDGDMIQAFSEQTGGEGVDSNSGDANPGDKPREIPGNAIHLKVIMREGGSEVAFRIKKTTKIEKVMKSYYQSQRKVPETLRFFYENLRLNGPETPESLEMEEDDFIDVYPEQKGGEGEASQAADGEPKEKNDKLEIVLRDNDGQDVTFAIKANTKMEKVMSVYCTRQAKAPGSLRFYTSEGVRINNDHTPTTLDLESGDVIDVHVEQLGGVTEESGSEVEIKPEDLDKPFSLKVKDQTGTEITFQVKNSTKLSKLISTFCKKQGQNVDSVRFFTPSGKRILPADTPASCELIDGDLIDVHMWQEGGRS